MTDKPDANLLQIRVEQMEKQLRGHRTSRMFLIGLLSCLIGVAVLDHWGVELWQGKTLSAERIVLKDENGVVRAELSYKDDTTSLSMYDRHSTPRVSLAVTEGDPGFHVYDEKGYRRAVLGFSPEGPQLVFLDRLAAQGAGLHLRKGGEIGLFKAEPSGRLNPSPLVPPFRPVSVY